MITQKWTRNFIMLSAATILILLFQNCGPAKLQGDFSQLPSSEFALGAKVDLISLQSANVESPSNILSPAYAEKLVYDYTAPAPVIENIVLRNNDFTQIIWVHDPSQTIVATGEYLNLPQFSPALVGSYSVFGYRGQTPYLLSRFELVEKTSPPLPVDSEDAVVITTSLVATDLKEELILIQYDAPAVDLSSAEFLFRGTAVQGQRAFVLRKPLEENLDVEVKLFDVNGRSYSRVVNLPPKLLPAAHPDLVVGNITTDPSRPILGQPVKFLAVVTNLSNASVPAGVPITVTFSVDGTVTNWTMKNVGGMGPGATLVLAADGGIQGAATWLSTSTSHAVVASVNADLRFPEANHSNNQKDLAMTVTLPETAANSICGKATENSLINLVCPQGKIMKQIAFASYGSPTGTCGTFQQGNCHSTTTVAIVSRECLDKATCRLAATNSLFGDPCSTVTKSLAVEAICGN